MIDNTDEFSGSPYLLRPRRSLEQACRETLRCSTTPERRCRERPAPRTADTWTGIEATELALA